MQQKIEEESGHMPGQESGSCEECIDLAVGQTDLQEELHTSTRTYSITNPHRYE